MMDDFVDKRKHNPRRKNLSPKLRFEILRRDGFTCQYCGKTGTDKELEIDHVVPFSKGGTNDEGNLITSCFDCNRGKRDTEIIPNDEQMPAKATPIDETETMFKLCQNKVISNKPLAAHFNEKMKPKKNIMDYVRTMKRDGNNYLPESIKGFNEMYTRSPETVEHLLRFGEGYDQWCAAMCISAMTTPRDEKQIRPGMHI